MSRGVLGPARRLVLFVTLVVSLPSVAAVLLDDAGGSNPVPVVASRAAPPLLGNAGDHGHDGEGLEFVRPLLAAGAGTRWVGADDAPGYDIEFRCPPVENATQTALGCPQYVLDEEDIMGQPRLLVDPRDLDLIAFHALHGGLGLHGLPGDQPPGESSRDDLLHQPHTVFQTSDGGQIWADNRYYSPWRGGAGGEYDDVYGEDNAAALDSRGRMYIGSLYAYKDDAEPGYHYAVALWKADRILFGFNSYEGLAILHPEALTNHVDSLHLSYIRDGDRVAALWRESRAIDPTAAAGAGLASWIEVAWTVPGEGAVWSKLAAEQRIGPCKQISNAVSQKGLLYVACLPDEGYSQPDADPGFWQIHAIDVAAQTTRRVDQTQVPGGEGGNGVLALSELRNQMFFAATSLGAEAAPALRLTMGREGSDWNVPANVGSKITNVTDHAGAQVIEARVQAMAVAPVSENIHILYMERYQRDAAQGGRLPTPEIWKAIAVMQPNAQSWLGKEVLNVGATPHRLSFEPQYQGLGDGAFNDKHDDLVVVRDPDGHLREFIAFGDYGYVRLAELFEENADVFAGGFAEPPPPIPSPNPGVDPASVGVVAGALSGAMFLRLLAARKKHKVEAPSL